MAKGREIKLPLPAADDLFSTQEERDEAKREYVADIPLIEISDFPNHPYKVKQDESMLELAASIREKGVVNPALVRPKPEGGYEMVAGHRRKFASELAGKAVMPCIVRNLTDDEATIIMVDSNLQVLDKGGIYCGINAISHNLILVNRGLLLNPSAFILGVPGSGKSMLTKMFILLIILSTSKDQVLVYDPEGEYEPLVQALGGVSLPICAGTLIYLICVLRYTINRIGKIRQNKIRYKGIMTDTLPSIFPPI